MTGTDVARFTHKSVSVIFEPHCTYVREVGLVTSALMQQCVKTQPDATVGRYLFTTKLLYMFRVSQHPSSGVLKTVTAASGTGHNTGTATSLQPVPIRPRWREVAVPVL